MKLIRPVRDFNIALKNWGLALTLSIVPSRMSRSSTVFVYIPECTIHECACELGVATWCTFDRHRGERGTRQSRGKPLSGKIRFAAWWGATGRHCYVCYAATWRESADESKGCACECIPRERVNMISGIQIALKNAIDVVSDNRSVATTTTTTASAANRAVAIRPCTTR